jgi:predicted RNA-binding protein
MCLSTAYLGVREDDKIAARYVDSITVKDGKVILTDVMGAVTEIEGTISYVDLTGGAVIIQTESN